jgi:hypothetical protein
MSIIKNKTHENTLQNDEEILILREIFNIIEDKNKNKKVNDKNNELIEKYHIKDIKIDKLSNINSNPKNKYKSKLQKILLKKKF